MNLTNFTDAIGRYGPTQIHSDADGQLKPILRELFSNKEYRFQEIIHANLYENLKLEELAFLTGLSVSSFQRKFKSIFHSSPRRYMLDQRLQKAKELLQNSSLRISEIAADCGFEDVGHFSKSFAVFFSVSCSVPLFALDSSFELWLVAGGYTPLFLNAFTFDFTL